ncbi:PREDICTED: serine/threonine-protein kinase rio2 [Rhagoletis zephyria]|uniref:serine/threonine-protein kinase rio2 n=1 Tax=Rhagoletis zephyria TaxID=28612 RepID=UPI000811A33C|nr:PREDICTED: serine/threonine-protein kinase rio2 [Rhagoletis zephyria]
MSSSEDEQSESQLQSDDGEQQELDLDASDTDSDEDDENSDDELVKPKSLEEKVTEELTKKYSERQGKQLYIRFPHKLPEEDDEFQEQAKTLSPLIVKAHKPRQKHARFCLVDFNSREDRDIAFKAIKASAKKSERKIVVSIPRTENSEFVQELVQRRINALEKKKAKARLRHASKLALRAKNFTSSIVITNLPRSASKAEVRRLFPTAVDVQIKPRKGHLIASSIAAVTLPTTMEARAAVKKKQSLGGTELKIRYDTQQLKKPRSKSKTKDRRKGHKGLQPAAKN